LTACTKKFSSCTSGDFVNQDCFTISGKKFLERVGVVRSGEGKAPRRPYCGHQYLKGACKKDGERLFSRICCDKTRENGFKVKEGRFNLDRRRKFFTVRVVKHWNRLPREVVAAPSLEMFKVRLGGALSNLLYLKMSLLIAGDLG